MAIFNEILSGRYNRALQKIFAIKGRPPVRQLGGEVTPVHFLFSGVENRFVEQWNTFAATVTVAAIAGQNSAVQIRNPVPGSGVGVVAVIERLSVINALAGGDYTLLSQDTKNTDLTTASVLRCLDNRPVRGGTSTLGSALRVSNQNNFVQTGGLIWRTFTNTTESSLITDDNQELPLLPGDAYEVVTLSNAALLVVNLRWRERALEESEAA